MRGLRHILLAYISSSHSLIGQIRGLRLFWKACISPLQSCFCSNDVEIRQFYSFLYPEKCRPWATAVSRCQRQNVNGALVVITEVWAKHRPRRRWHNRMKSDILRSKNILNTGRERKGTQLPENSRLTACRPWSSSPALLCVSMRLGLVSACTVPVLFLYQQTVPRSLGEAADTECVC